MFPNTMLRSFAGVLIPVVIISWLTYQGYYNNAKVELGLAHYAEKVLPTWKPYLPKWFKMPFNTLINMGYVIIGAAWCAITSVAVLKTKMTDTDSNLFYHFNFMSCVYGPIQALRILTQIHGFGVLDQWYTLPFFMWVFIWGLYLKHGWSFYRAFLLEVLSFSCYALVLFSDIGFEICLGIHMLLAVTGGIVGWRAHPQARAGWSLVGALVSCCGFVVLKLLDHELVKYHVFFQYVSGHFISKIFDILQIHFVNNFFFIITMAAHADRKKKKE